jgi:tetratricopeptide (TPR) repeat protein
MNGSWRIGLLVLALMVGLLASSAASPLAHCAQTSGSSAQQQFARGVALQQKGDLEGARQAYEAALKQSPQRVDVLSNLGLVYSRLGNQDRAIKCFHEALRIDSKQNIVRFNLAVAYMREGKFEPAQTELAMVVKTQPDNLVVHNLLGLCLLKLNREAEGIKELEVVRDAHPADADVDYTLASAYIKTDELDKAEPIVHQLEGSDTPAAHFLVGSYYLARYDHRRAVKEFEQTVQEDAKFPEAHAQLAYAYFFDFQWDRSVKMCEEELALNPDDDNAVKLLGSLYRQRGRLEEAEKLLDKAEKQHPNDYEILYQVGLLAQARNDYPRAVEVLENVTKLKPDFPPAHITLVRAYSRLKRTSDAQREQAIVDKLNTERKNQPTVRDKALYDALKTNE